MNRPHIEKLRIQNYGCIKDIDIQLTPLHALIGPNDSGKSTVLRALRALSLLATSTSISAALNAEEVALHSAILEQSRAAPVRFSVSARGATWTVEYRNGERWELVEVNGKEPIGTRVSGTWGHARHAEDSGAADASAAVQGSYLVRLDPDAMRAASPLIPDGTPLRFANDRGTGLPAVYDAIMVRDLQAYIDINERLKRLFPPVKSLRTKNPTHGTKAIGVQLVDGTFVPAEHMSEGLLYFLAFAALPHLEPAALVLIEEPENGLHPARIAEVMRVLREVSKTTQVVMATHSPLVINELEGHEVTVLTRTTEEGTKARLLKDTFNYEERSKVYANGELWLSYANGEDERELFQAPEAAQ
jgi:ABC-type cobalamin/Fe3+-siderophores transport system ATPase subunit